jgi:hypothetical protein
VYESLYCSVSQLQFNRYGILRSTLLFCKVLLQYNTEFKVPGACTCMHTVFEKKIKVGASTGRGPRMAEPYVI